MLFPSFFLLFFVFIANASEQPANKTAIGCFASYLVRQNLPHPLVSRGKKQNELPLLPSSSILTPGVAPYDDLGPREWKKSALTKLTNNLSDIIVTKTYYAAYEKIRLFLHAPSMQNGIIDETIAPRYDGDASGCPTYSHEVGWDFQFPNDIWLTHNPCQRAQLLKPHPHLNSHTEIDLSKKTYSTCSGGTWLDRTAITQARGLRDLTNSKALAPSLKKLANQGKGTFTENSVCLIPCYQVNQVQASLHALDHSLNNDFLLPNNDIVGQIRTFPLVVITPANDNMTAFFVQVHKITPLTNSKLLLPPLPPGAKSF